MVLSESIAINGPHWPQRCHLMELPMELHICIRDQLLVDPDSTVNELRSLRLVCKTFNDIWSPVVVTNMVLFRTGDINDALPQLRHIVHGKSNVSTLAGYTTLTIKNLYCVDLPEDKLRNGVRRVWEQGIIAVLMWLLFSLIGILFWLITFIALLIYSALTIYPIILGIRCLIAIPGVIKELIATHRARYYMTLLPRKLNMRNIRRVRLCLDEYDSDWAIYHSTKILLSLPHFTELELGLADATDLEYLVRCLEPLKELRKLTLFLPSMTNLSQLRCFAALISNNGNLAHLDLRSYIHPDFSDLFCDVPTTKPLKLQHLSLIRWCTSTSFGALIPHIRSLSSVEFLADESNPWCISFSQAKIFPSTIKVEILDQELVTFISEHPGLVSLTIVDHRRLRAGAIPEVVSSFCKALTLHSETLQRIFFSERILYSILINTESQKNFLRSIGNLREFVLETTERSFYFPVTSEERVTLSVIACMTHSFTVIIKAKDKAIFLRCLAFCRDSPFMHDLARRIVYERM